MQPLQRNQHKPCGGFWVAATSASGIPKAHSISLQGTSFDVLSTCKASESMAGRKWENNFLQEKLEKFDQAKCVLLLIHVYA